MFEIYKKQNKTKTKEECIKLDTIEKPHQENKGEVKPTNCQNYNTFALEFQVLKPVQINTTMIKLLV